MLPDRELLARAEAALAGGDPDERATVADALRRRADELEAGADAAAFAHLVEHARGYVDRARPLAEWRRLALADELYEAESAAIFGKKNAKSRRRLRLTLEALDHALDHPFTGAPAEGS